MHPTNSRNRTRNALAAIALTALPALVGGCALDVATRTDVPVTFEAHRQAIPDFHQDTGYLPAESPVQIRAVFTADGESIVRASGTVDSTRTPATLQPAPGSGSFDLGAGVHAEITIRIDVPGPLGSLHYEGPLMGAPSLAVAFSGHSEFEPFLLDGQSVIDADVPETQLAAIPLSGAVPIPGIGGTLIIRAGGTVHSAFSGACAGVSSNGDPYFAGHVRTRGTLVLHPSIQIDLPGFQRTIGPFEVSVPIPEMSQPVALDARRDGADASTPQPAETASGMCAMDRPEATPDASSSDASADVTPVDPDAATPDVDAGTPTEPADAGTPTEPADASTGSDAGDAPSGPFGTDAGSAPAYGIDRDDHRTLDLVGGISSTPFGQMCAPGEVIVGLAGRSGENVDQLQFVCAALHADGSLGPDHILASAGGSGGTPFFDHCPLGQIVVGVGGSAGDNVDQIGIVCADARSRVFGTDSPAGLTLHGSSPLLSSRYVRVCPEQYAMYWLYGTADRIVHSFTPVCERLVYTR